MQVHTPKTRDELIHDLLTLGYRLHSTASMKWKIALLLRKGEKTLVVLIRTRGVDILETPQPREAMTNSDGKLSVRASDAGNRLGEFHYTKNDVSVNWTVLNVATRFAEGLELSPDHFQKTGIGRREWAERYGELSKPRERGVGDSSLADVYYAASSGDGGPAYLSDSVWINSDLTLDDRGD